MSWPLVNINDICRPKQWKTVSSSKLLEEGYPVYGANGRIGYYSEYTHEFPTLMITCRGATCGNVHISVPKAYINGNAMALDGLDSEKYSIKYLFYYFKSRGFNDVISGSAQPQITRQGLSKIEIPLPPLPVQKQIAAVLEKADTLRSQCQQMEQELNSLAQSVFLDMFGDPLKNEVGYPKKKLIELVNDKDDIKCGPFGTQLKKSEFVDTGVPLWGIKHVNSGFTIHTHEYVTIEKASYLDSYSLNSGDIVMTRKGTVGNCHLYPSELPAGVMHSDLLKITVDSSKIIPEFLVRQFRISKDIERQLLLISQGAIMAGINVGKLKSLEVAVPPITEQIEFVRIIDTISSQLTLNASQSKELQDNFESLMQHAFKGELDLKDVA